MDYRFLLDLALILLATKLLGIFARRIGMPQVVGMLIAGILIGPAIPELFGGTGLVSGSDTLKIFAEIGVIMLMFTAGLETDIKELKKTGKAASLIALMGVLLPLALGFGLGAIFVEEAFSNSAKIMECVFIGVIIVATSVGITVEALREMGKLKGKIGTIILSAAIIDDVIGIIILSIVTGVASGESSVGTMIINTGLFFVLAISVGICLNYLFKWISKRHPHQRRVPIYSLVMCFAFAFCAEELFGVADITGAYIAGIMLSGMKESHYVDRKIDISSYMLFTPIFFASIGINLSFNSFSLNFLWFGLAFVAVAIFSKIVGCGGAAKLCGFSTKDSAKIGVGMIARGEVALIIADTGIASGVISSSYIVPVVMLIIISSFLCPILLKLLFKNDPTDFSNNLNGGVKVNVAKENMDYLPDDSAFEDNKIQPKSTT